MSISNEPKSGEYRFNPCIYFSVGGKEKKKFQSILILLNTIEIRDSKHHKNSESGVIINHV